MHSSSRWNGCGQVTFKPQFFHPESASDDPALQGHGGDSIVLNSRTIIHAFSISINYIPFPFYRLLLTGCQGLFWKLSETFYHLILTTTTITTPKAPRDLPSSEPGALSVSSYHVMTKNALQWGHWDANGCGAWVAAHAHTISKGQNWESDPFLPKSSLNPHNMESVFLHGSSVPMFLPFLSILPSPHAILASIRSPLPLLSLLCNFFQDANIHELTVSSPSNVQSCGLFHVFKASLPKLSLLCLNR